MADSRRPPLQEKASQETFISLLQLEPMPIADGTDFAAGSEKDLPPLPDSDSAAARGVSPLHSGRAATTSSLGLTSSGHGAVYYLSRVQRYSSYAFGIFSSVHLVATSIVPLVTRSVPASESFLLLAREIYQTRISETLLVVVPVVAHVAAGIGLRLVRRSHSLRRYGGATPGLWPALSAKSSAELRGALAQDDSARWWTLSPRQWLRRLDSHWRATVARLRAGWPPLSLISMSGYGFMLALAAHVGVNRLLPLAVAGDSSDIGLGFVSHGFARHPALAWLSYTSFLALASGHMVWGWARWLNLAQAASWAPTSRSHLTIVSGTAAAEHRAQKRRLHTWLALQGGVLLVFAAWAAGGLGVVARGGRMQGWLGEVYDGLFQKAYM